MENADMPGRSPSILVVDDDVDTCQNLHDILQDLGYRVEVAHDGFAALDLVRRRPFDLALLDLKMPGMDGLTLYREIRKLRAGTVAMIVSAYASATTTEAALAAGAWRVLAKPVDFDQMLGLVREAVDQPLVMVVDDDSDLCSNLWDLLRQEGYRVCLAHDEKEAAERLKDREFKVVLIDMKLPGCDGTQVFRLVRNVNPNSRIVVVTAFRAETEKLVEQVTREGADAVCYKPFDVSGLLKTLEQLTRERG
jgi:CheY-like chemotaxis protein